MIVRNPSLNLYEMRQSLHKEFLIIYVVKDTHTDKTHESLKVYCQLNNIRFICRNYDSKSISEDQEHIISLPAIHIYVNETFLETYHYNFVQFIENEIDKYDTKQKTKKQKREKWFQYIKTICMLKSKKQNKLMKC